MCDDFKKLELACKTCKKCGLHSSRTNVVFGTGNIHSEVIFIGEGPGANEDLQGEPFVGKAGILLDKMLAAIDLDRKKNIYITNIVKCRPPQNRDPEPSEQDSCAAWLEAQISLIDPKIIVCVGRISAMRFISSEIKITKEHGIFVEKNGRLYMATLHPAALLRNPSQKPAAFQDFLNLREKIKEICKSTYSKP